MRAGSAQDRSERRAQIVAVAYRLIAERGLEGLRFADVAKQAGINNGTLLYYFASKDALIQAVGMHLVEIFSDTGQPPGLMLIDALAQLRFEFADARERLHEDVGVVYTELLARSRRDPAVAALLLDIDAAWRGWLQSILKHGRDTGYFRDDLDLELVATTIMAAIRGVGMQALVQRDASRVEPVMDALAAAIERWIVSPDYAVDRGPASPTNASASSVSEVQSSEELA